MPWCDDCDKYLNPNTVVDDGSCPWCGHKIAAPAAIKRARRGRGSSPDAIAARADRPPEAIEDEAKSTDASTPLDGDEGARTPWHFKVLLVALVIYLGWRLVELVLWVGHKL